MRLSICDDDQKSLDYVARIIKKIYGDAIEVKKYLHPEDLEKACRKGEKEVPDILMTDICFGMQDKKGIELSAGLRRTIRLQQKPTQQPQQP